MKRKLLELNRDFFERQMVRVKIVLSMVEESSDIAMVRVGPKKWNKMIVLHESRLLVSTQLVSVMNWIVSIAYTLPKKDISS